MLEKQYKQWQRLLMAASRCIIYSTILFDLDMTGRHLKLKTPHTPSPEHHIVKRPSAAG